MADNDGGPDRKLAHINGIISHKRNNFSVHKYLRRPSSLYFSLLSDLPAMPPYLAPIFCLPPPFSSSAFGFPPALLP
jgi:hypothetical protein